MKLIYIIIVFTISSCKPSNMMHHVIYQEGISKFEFLKGNWIRTNGKDSIVTRERWVIENPSELEGHGYSLKGSDTIFQEKMTIVKEDSLWYLVVEMPNDSIKTKFAMTEVSDSTFTCVNPENDFPKTISYSKKHEELRAQISGGGPKIDFVFKRAE